MKSKYQTQIAILKQRQRQRANELQKDSTPLQALNAEYQNKLNLLRHARDEKIQAINHQIVEQSHRINPIKGKADVRLVTLLYRQCENQLAYSARNRDLSTSEKIKKINQDLQIIRQTAQEMIKVINPPKFQEYDDINTARQKTRWLIKIAHLEYLFASEKVMLANNQLLMQNQIVNKKIVSDFREYEKKHSFENEGVLIKMLRKRDDDPLNQPKPVTQNMVQEFIDHLENKYMKARGF